MANWWNRSVIGGVVAIWISPRASVRTEDRIPIECSATGVLSQSDQSQDSVVGEDK